MRVALQLSGQVRGKEEIFPKLKQNIIDVTNCDVYMYICQDKSSEGLLKLLSSLKIDPIHIVITEDKLIKKNGVRPISALEDSSVQRYYQQLYGVMQVNNLRKESQIEYDWVIRSRADLSIEYPFPDLSKFYNDKLYIPHGNDCLGLNDRFAFSSPEIMNKYCNMFNWIDSLETKSFNAEWNLKLMVKKEKIPVERFIYLGLHRVGKEEAQREKPKWKNFKFKERWCKII